MPPVPRDLCFSVKRHETAAIDGPSGSGKSPERKSQLATIGRMYRLLGRLASVPGYWALVVAVGILPMIWQYAYAKPFGLIIQHAAAGRVEKYWSVLLLRWLQLKLRWAIRREFFGHILDLPVSYYENNHSGDIISRLSNDVREMTNGLAWSSTHVFSTVSSGVFACIVIGLINWKSMLVAIVFGLLYSRWADRHGNRQEALGEAAKTFTDLLAGTWVISIFGLQQ